MKQYYALILISFYAICASPIFSKQVTQVQKNEKQPSAAVEVLSDEQQDLKSIQDKLVEDAERNWTSYPAFDYKDVQGSIEILDKLVVGATLNLDSGIKVFARKTTRDMHVLLPILDTYPRIAQKMNQEKLEQLRALVK